MMRLIWKPTPLFFSLLLKNTDTISFFTLMVNFDSWKSSKDSWKIHEKAFSNGDFLTKFYNNLVKSYIIKKSKSAFILSYFFQFKKNEYSGCKCDAKSWIWTLKTAFSNGDFPTKFYNNLINSYIIKKEQIFFYFIIFFSIFRNEYSGCKFDAKSSILLRE